MLLIGKVNIPAMANGGISVKVNGQELVFDQEPVIVNDRVLVPIRKICDAIGAEIYYESVEGYTENGVGTLSVICIIKGNNLVTMISGQYGPYERLVGKWHINKYDIPENDGDFVDCFNYYEGYYDGTAAIMEVEPVIMNGRTLVPVRVLTEYLGADVNWVNETRCVEITVDNTAPARTAEYVAQCDSFTYDQADEIFFYLPEAESMEGPIDWYGRCFNKYGLVHVYTDGTIEVMIYPNGTVAFADWETKMIYKTVTP